MPRYFVKIRNRLTACLAVLLLSACASGPPAPVVSIPDEAYLAQQALATGNFSEAARLWQEASLVTVGSERHQYRLQSAEAWFQAGETPRSVSMLGQVDERQLLRDRQALFSLLHAELALASSDADTAQVYLAAARQNLTANQRSRYDRLLARTSRLQTDPASYAMATVASALRTGNTYDIIRGIAILQLLEDVRTGVLRNISTEMAHSYGLKDWPELTVLIRETLVNGDDLNLAAAGWSENYPDHEVTEQGFKELAGRYRQLFSLPSNIAVLLPTQGGLAAAGKAIRDGLVSAFLASPEGVSLKFYPTTKDPQSAVSAYFQAMGEGAQWIIGPLRRESVEALSDLGSLSVPVLALNTPRGDASSRSRDNLLFKLSLSQENEASAIARKALENGHTRAIMLTSDTAWGRRMESAFGEAFTSGGGSISTTAQFSPSENDHSSMLTDILKIDESKERKDRVQATLGITLNFEATRRDDFDLVFLAASPVQGRQIRPQLRFHDAGEKPVYAMSRIYGGSIDPASDQDLNGVFFPSTHFQLSMSATGDAVSLASIRGGSFAALHALGRDAWNVLPWLPLMRKDPDLRFPGSVGSLSMNPEGQLLRDPAWARFSRGRPVPVTWPKGVQ